MAAVTMELRWWRDSGGGSVVEKGKGVVAVGGCEIGAEECATKDVKHAVAITSAQKNKGSLEAESIVRAASTRVRFRLSTTPFYSGVRGVDV
ncbi:hypothetical protein Tco_0910283 [Tanacetum coccineum]|uniref:Uncharacterized protein n=1 Tax=Tanacetum coccineum TaxID=301880 RepID=A0ABQ5CST4_9ASTR